MVVYTVCGCGETGFFKIVVVVVFHRHDHNKIAPFGMITIFLN